MTTWLKAIRRPSGENVEVSYSPITKRSTIRLSSSDILNLDSISKVLIPKPKEGFANIPLYLVSFCPLATPYNFSGNFEVRFGTDWVFPVGQFQVALQYGDGTDAFGFDPLMNFVVGGGGGPYPGVVPFELHSLGEVTDGDGIAILHVDYLPVPIN